MIRLPVLLLPLALTACAAAPIEQPVVGRCDVTIKFGSYGMGIDQDVSTRVTAAVKTDRDVAGSERKPWGKEGEYDLCLATKPGRAAAVYERYRAMIPPRGLKAPTSIEGPDGMRFESIAPM
jgi:hypothetical protein